MSIKMMAFEHYMLADDRDSNYPMTFWLKASFRGIPDESRLRAAIDWATARHPLTLMQVRGNASGTTAGMSFVADDSGTRLPPLLFGDGDNPLPFPGGAGAIDLRQEPGLRFFVQVYGPDAILLMQCHHAVVDAMGATRVLEDLLLHYGNQTEAARPSDVTLLPKRGSFHLTRFDIIGRMWRDLLRIGKFLINFPQPLAVPSASPSEPTPRKPASVHIDLSHQEFSALRNDVKQQGGTVNDVMISQLFMVLDGRNRKQGEARPIRIGMPINMRRHNDDTMPAANVVSMCFLDRSPREMNQSRMLLSSVIRETKHIKLHYLGYAMILTVRVLGSLPGGLNLLSQVRWPWQCFATAILSNLGAPLNGSPLGRNDDGLIQSANLTLTTLELLPPIRHGTTCAFGVVTEAKRTRITLHYDSRILGESAALSIIDSYRAALSAEALHNTLKTQKK